MTIRAVATGLFGFITAAIVTAFISANVRELARQRGWDTFLVRWWDALPEQWRDELRWERLRRRWWLWSLFGLSGGVVLSLWLTPPVFGPPQSETHNTTHEAVQAQLKEALQEREKANQDLGALQSQLSSKSVELGSIKQQLTAIQFELSSRQAELDEAKRQLSQSIGPGKAISFASELGLADNLKTMPKTFVILTATSDNEILRGNLENILGAARGISDGKSNLLPTGLPNYQKDLDAPRLEERGVPGITIHGRNAAGNLLMRVLSHGHCLIHQTGDTPTQLLSYYHLLYPNSTDVNDITWIEIGPGSAATVSVGCFQ